MRKHLVEYQSVFEEKSSSKGSGPKHATFEERDSQLIYLNKRRNYSKNEG
jgi:hypothetical protein